MHDRTSIAIANAKQALHEAEVVNAAQYLHDIASAKALLTFSLAEIEGSEAPRGVYELEERTSKLFGLIYMAKAGYAYGRGP